MLDDTVVVVTSDHGENIGDHGLMDQKMSVHDTLLLQEMTRRVEAWLDRPARRSR
jgi:arylsulfatase A-like enzyme